MKNLLLPVLLASGLLQGCLNDSSDNSELSLSITDAPIDFAAAVNIEISGVELHSNDGTYTFDFETPKVINLLELQGSEAETTYVNLTRAYLATGKTDKVKALLDSIKDRTFYSKVQALR